MRQGDTATASSVLPAKGRGQEPGSIGTGVLSEWQFSQRRTARGLAYPQVVEWCAEEGSEPTESQSLPESPGQALLGWQQGVGCWLPL